MSRPELLTRFLISATVVAALAAAVLIWQRTPLIHARMADSGGWSPDVLQAKVGEPLRLRLTSDDVMHGFAVGQMDMQDIDVEPGKVTNVTLTFDKPGTYTFYCTRWCGINHWRMRGTIEVSGPPFDTPASVARPMYAALGLDIDAAHPAAVTPKEKPSAGQGAVEASLLSSNDLTRKYAAAEYYRSRSPAQVFGDLRADPGLRPFTDAEVWDLVAYVWQSNTSPEGLAMGEQLFARNCAACHGESGGGNGVFAGQLAAGGSAGPGGMLKRPANFTDPTRMLGASPAILEGKILRGGMGTGMPSWGPIFSEADIWKIVSYLYAFQFKEFTP
jgi:mono/diheme cytochrome c family protein/plastocyanin